MEILVNFNIACCLWSAFAEGTLPVSELFERLPQESLG